MSGFTDYHAHFVYGVDDGAQTRDEMYAMLDAAVAWTMFFLPIAVACRLLNLFIGQVLAVFDGKGFWALSEVEQGVYNIENRVKLVYIPYQDVVGIEYKAT